MIAKQEASDSFHLIMVLLTNCIDDVGSKACVAQLQETLKRAGIEINSEKLTCDEVLEKIPFFIHTTAGRATMQRLTPSSMMYWLYSKKIVN